MGVYICYYHCSARTNEVNIVNAQGRAARYRLTAYDRAGDLLINEKRELRAHQAERLTLNDLVAGQDGKIMVNPVDDDDHEFPAVLAFSEAEDGPRSVSLVPFVRVDELEENDDEDENDEGERAESKA